MSVIFYIKAKKNSLKINIKKMILHHLYFVDICFFLISITFFFLFNYSIRVCMAAGVSVFSYYVFFLFPHSFIHSLKKLYRL